MRIRLWHVLLLSMGFSTPAMAQYVVNLADPSGTSNTRPIGAGSTPTIVLQNRLPHVRYWINLGLAYRPEPPITPAGSIPALKAGVAAGALSVCETAEEAAKQPLQAWEKEFASEDNETAVPSLLKRGEAIVIEMITKCGGAGNLSDHGRQIRDRVEAIARSTEMVIPNAPMVGEGQQLTVRVGREAPAREWVLILDTPSTGSWLTSYGINFGANFSRDYFSKANTGAGQDGTFTITKKQRRALTDTFQYVPSVLFTRVGADAPARNFWAFAFGFGSTQESPAAIVGMSYVVRQNAQIVFGGMFSGVRDLKGEYTEGQILKENLSSETLTKSGVMITPFFGISLNFSSNPFAGDAPKKEAGTPPSTETPAGGTTGGK